MSPDERERLTIVVSQSPSSLRVALSGEANLKGADSLGAVLAKVHADAVSTLCTEVIMDLNGLEFMSSSCFRKLVSWIVLVENLDANSRYRIRFISNPLLHWQRRSLNALRCFALELVTVETVEA